MSEFVVYSLVDANKTPFYVGQTCNPQARELNHRSRFSEPFTFVIVCRCVSRHEAQERERRTIEELQSSGVLLYNVAHNSPANGHAALLEDLDVPPVFSRSFYRKVIALAEQAGATPDDVVMRALCLFEEDRRRAPHSQPVKFSVEDTNVVREMHSQFSKDWWSKISEKEKRERAMKAVAGRNKQNDKTTT